MMFKKNGVQFFSEHLEKERGEGGVRGRVGRTTYNPVMYSLSEFEPLLSPLSPLSPPISKTPEISETPTNSENFVTYIDYYK
jgi:hypothetical protein